MAKRKLTEYERKRAVGEGRRNKVRFDKWYDGKLEMNVDLLGTPATVIYDCDERFGMTAGLYMIRGHAEGVSKIESVLRSKYGTGIVQQITEAEARQRGCLWNFSIPHSRFWRPSEWISWRVDDRFHIDMLVCGGRSTTTLLFYSDPALVASASTGAGDAAAQDRPRYQEGDL